ncbi:creatininase [Amycolatopsis jejuensis]|uniref:creatininase n=1 Tax=Amycolatopsis jejuensis TaxID=330084 RepID=UPI0007C4684B|nr:creatininase [Amycolatopsis jejuensis]
MKPVKETSGTMHMLADLTWVEAREAIERGAGVLVPIGALEQHGPHLPLSMDALAVTEAAKAVAQRLDVLIAPTISYGCRSKPLSGGGPAFPGGVGLEPRTYMALVENVVRELLRSGFERIVVLSGHWENRQFTYEAVYQARQPDDEGTARVMVIESLYGDTVRKSTLDEIFGDDWPGLAREHAAIVETSVLQHVRPELVRADRSVDDAQERFPWWDVVPAPPEFTTKTGVMWKATRATPEFGRKIWADVVEALTTAIDEELFSGSRAHRAS